MKFFFHKNAKNILGINARNLHYLGRFNSRANKKFADDKIFTKQFLESRNIGVAKLFHIISSHNQLTEDFYQGLPQEFVIKPNKGFAGAGIIVVSGRKKEDFVTVSGKIITLEQIHRHCLDTLEGKYSISGVSDKIIFEEKLEMHEDLKKLTSIGLPDIRVIVFNMIPVMAMLRLSTKESDGKANLELGAIGLGIDIGTGKTNGGSKYKKRVKTVPNGESTVGFQIPHWDEVLQSVAKIQKVTKIGFLGVDLVITGNGVQVLEVNARPGTKIQICNNALLRSRLEKVSDITVHDAEEAVSIAKKLFSQSRSKNTNKKLLDRPVLGSEENVVIHLKDKPKTVHTKISLWDMENRIRPGLLGSDEKLLDITLRDKRLKLPIKEDSDMEEGVDLVLASKYLGGFYIDPIKPFEAQDLAAVMTADADRKRIQSIDQKLCDIDSQIKLLAYLNPRNGKEQKDIFLKTPNYSPRFIYKEKTLDIEPLLNDLEKISPVDHPLYSLYEAKKKEIEYKLKLISTENAEEYAHFSDQVFGEPTLELYQEALASAKAKRPNIKEDTSAEVDYKKARTQVQNFLKKYDLGFWEISILTDSVVDMQVTKRDKILLRKGSTFKKNRLQALLVHEIGTHVFRFENGKRQPLKIFQRGTANYLRTEEGLAVWNQRQIGVNLGMKDLTPELHVIAEHLGRKMSFEELFHYLKDTFDIDDDTAWHVCIKSKRGMQDTSKPYSFTKDIVYYTGLKEVEGFLANGGSIVDLYVGKITTGDLDLIQGFEGLVKSKFLLDFHK